MRNNYTLPTIMLAGAALAACSMQPEKNSALEEARSGYSAAQSNPDVTNLAAIELQQAGKAMDKANDAQSKREDSKTVDHLAYLAKQRVAIAQETAKQKAAELAVANASTERDKVRLEVRTAEADAAKQQMATAQEAAKLNADELAVANADIERGKVRLETQMAESDAAAKQQAASSEAAAALAAANADTERGKVRLETQAAEADAARQQAMIAQESANLKMAELSTANARISQMEAELKDLNAKKTERGMVITLGDVLFDTNKAELRSGGVNNVQKLAEFLKEYPERKALIEGFTDSTGDSSYNQDLSDRRANAVRNTLMNMGVSSDRVSTRGYGEENPVASNETTAGRQMNRRVEIILSDDNGSIAPR